MLGDLPPLLTPEITIIETRREDGFRIEKIAFDNGADATVYGWLLLPDELAQPAPAILYQHYHGGRYELGKDVVFQQTQYSYGDGVTLVKQGYVVLAVDSYAFGERQQQGPAGERESGRQTEHALFKQFLWQGKSLWGMIVRDDLLALNYLCTRPEVDPSRIGTTGMSMGGSRATWLSALDDRIRVTIPLNQMVRCYDFDARGDYERLSFYLFVPGLLAAGIDMEHIASLTAPRPQLVLVGGNDVLSPTNGVRVVDQFAQHIYGLYEAADHFETVIYPGVGHEYTPEIHRSMLDYFARYL